MKALEMNKTIRKEHGFFIGKLALLMNGYVKSLVENSAGIIAGMQAISGNTNAYQTYILLKSKSL